ncbi:hypothetical protein [Myxococcus sp. CA040A]|uniref:hypothetical protein n=1 Tax=Myxococcus sp. CA040A TaxID=2741738 RepID=UPI00157A547B|nr:hypothetical protein [Myxococcus sp. CA040A]NTX08755.1 hypothetical protein [Myxococcus sp. CA040A]
MRVKSGLALCCLGWLGCGDAPLDATSREEPALAQVTAQVCSGLAQRVKIVVPPGTPESPAFIVAPSGLVDVQGTLYFGVNFQDGRATLWRSQGTDASTVPVKSFPATTPARNRELGPLVATGNKLFFRVWNADTGLEPWISDGTEVGTHLVKDVTPGPGDSQMSLVTAQSGAVTFFLSVPLSSPPRTQVELWRSNGTAAGTVQVVNFGTEASLSSQSMRVGNALLFFLSQPDGGTTLWRTDGTAGGTAFVKRLDSGVVPVGDVGSTEDGGRALFTLHDGANTEVWKTNGTAAGTVRLETFGKSMRMLGSLGGFVYLTNADPATQRLGLYRVALAGGGKATITQLPNPFANQPDALPFLQEVARSNGKLYFSVAISSPSPSPRTVRLWVTDGTAAQTRQLPGFLSVSDEYISPVFATGASAVLFSAAPLTAFTNLWVTRGTDATTAEVTTSPPLETSSPFGFARSGTRVFYAARDDTSRYQLWAVPANISCTP